MDDAEQKRAAPDAKITQAEMIELFGEEIPIEAAVLVLNAPGHWTCSDVRQELRKIAGKKRGADQTQAALVEAIAAKLLASVNAPEQIIYTVAREIAALQPRADSEADIIVGWMRDEAQICDCHARESGECACGAWDSEVGERSCKTAYIEDLADAIEWGAHLKGTDNG